MLRIKTNVFSSYLGVLGASAVAFLMVDCNKPAKITTTSPAYSIASLVPAATDLLIGMGAKNHLVAVSTYDRQRPDVDDLPKAGDYQTIDWELIQQLRPNSIVVQVAKDRLPAGFNERADRAETAPVNVTINRLADISNAIDILGGAIHDPDLAKSAKTNFESKLNAVHSRVGIKNPVPVLLVISDSGDAVVGTETYLDDLVRLAGGENVAKVLHNSWPSVDREMMRSLNPEVIIQLLPLASAQQKERAANNWKNFPDIPAVRNGRVYTIENWYALLPGWHVTDLAEQFYQCLHPSLPTTSPQPN